MTKTTKSDAKDQLYSGINIQYPISELILSGKKTIETRTYKIPEKYIGKELVLVETPGKQGKFKARMRGIIVFDKCFKYKNKKEFYADEKRTCVSKDSEWKWSEAKGKWGWPIKKVIVFKKNIPLSKRGGIVFHTNIKIDR